jgi:hypothetical protein
MQRTCRFENSVPVAPFHPASYGSHGALVSHKMSRFPSAGVTTKKTEENHLIIPSEEAETSEQKPISCAF